MCGQKKGEHEAFRPAHPGRSRPINYTLVNDYKKNYKNVNKKYKQ